MADLGDGTIVHSYAPCLVANDIILCDVDVTTAQDATVTVVIDSITTNLHLQLE